MSWVVGTFDNCRDNLTCFKAIVLKLQCTLYSTLWQLHFNSACFDLSFFTCHSRTKTLSRCRYSNVKLKNYCVPSSALEA